jgi:hypothetical protein
VPAAGFSFFLSYLLQGGSAPLTPVPAAGFPFFQSFHILWENSTAIERTWKLFGCSPYQ